MPRHVFPFLACAALIVPAAAGWGCAEEQRLCYPGDYVACECFDGSDGWQRCEDDGQAYGSCDCSGGLPQPAGDDDSAAGGGGYYY